MTGDVVPLFPHATNDEHDSEHPSVSARLRVVSDGTWAGTRVLANGKPVRNVRKVWWTSPESPTDLARIFIELVGVPVELEGEYDSPDVGAE